MRKDVKLGATYRHYSGRLYRVHAVVLHSETLEEMIMYEALYDNDLGKFWVRPKEMFLESIEKDGRSQFRFEEVEGL